jgi:tRNA threonylcarbamoyladenosine biosynthesis protein TsaB
MVLLAIETATPVLGCALWSGGAPLASFSLRAGRRHAELLMPAIDNLLSCAGVARSQLEAVAVDHGPGLFTGLRVGLAAAGAVSRARQLPCAAVSSLDVLAHAARRRPGLLASVVDARREEVYWCLYESDGDLVRPLSAAGVHRPEDVAAYLSTIEGPVLALGDGAWRYRALLAEACVEFGEPAEMLPRPEVLAELGAAEVAAGRAAVGTPPALYLRQADVRVGWEEVGGRVAP